MNVSANPRIKPAQVDAFVHSKKEWLQEALVSASQTAPDDLPLPFTDAQCLAFFKTISDLIYPLFTFVLNEKPRLIVKRMKSRWGVCHVKARTITLNTALMLKPVPAIEYVVLHEYVHFLHPDHQKGFHDTMLSLMPDYKQRRLLLK